MLIIPVKRLSENPFSSIIAYPQADRDTVQKRILELEKDGVTSIKFTGEKQIGNLRVLGKGCVGIVAVAYRKRRKVALKMRRSDADRGSMFQEKALLEKANALGVGPKLAAASTNFLIMRFVDGKLLPEWLKERQAKKTIRTVLCSLLEQCWMLDQGGLDHGELSHAPKHVIVTDNDEPVIVDFESASLKRKPANVTAICQFLFISGLSELLASKLGKVKKTNLVRALKIYKKQMNRVNFLRVLRSCGLK